MTFSILTEQEYQKFISNNDMTSFMQTVELSNLKKELGSKVHFVGVKKDKKVVAGSMILEDTTILNKKLFYALSLIDNNNKKNEYYLTDIVKIISKDNVVDAVVVPYDYHLIGINDQNTLLFVENEFKNAVK